MYSLTEINRRKMNNVKEEDLQSLREWMEKQPHLPSLPDEQLILFLHSSYYSIERAKQALDVCLTVRTHAPEMFSDRNPTAPHIQAAMNLIEGCKLPERDDKGQIVFFARVKDRDASKLVFDDVLKIAILAFELVITEDLTPPGYVFVFDMTGVSLAHLTRVNINTVRKFFVFVQEGFPVRIKAVHVLNTTPLIEKIIQFVKPFLNKELAKLLFFHTSDNEEDFYKEYNRDLMPKDYGGKEKSVTEMNDELKQFVIKNGPKYLEEEVKWRVDESKRSGKLVTRGGLFGVEGSFKKLDID